VKTGVDNAHLWMDQGGLENVYSGVRLIKGKGLMYLICLILFVCSALNSTGQCTYDYFLPVLV